MRGIGGYRRRATSPTEDIDRKVGHNEEFSTGATPRKEPFHSVKKNSPSIVIPEGAIQIVRFRRD